MAELKKVIRIINLILLALLAGIVIIMAILIAGKKSVDNPEAVTTDRREGVALIITEKLRFPKEA